MSIFQILALLITLTALFSYLNHHYFRLPRTIGVMLVSLLFSAGLMILGKMGWAIEMEAKTMLNRFDFDQVLLQGMLCFMLFAGALHIDLGELSLQKGAIAVFSTAGVILSTFMVGGGLYYFFPLVGLGLPLSFCFLFGALISPTDPIAVIGILKSAAVPKSLEIKVAGESLFNDGIGVVVYLAVLEFIRNSGEFSWARLGELLLVEAVGGGLLGLFLGWIAYVMLKRTDQYQVEILITLALAMGGYSLAGALHMSGPIAIVVAGLLIGNHGRAFAMSDKTREHLDDFWELIDEILNAVLFVLIGLEVLVLSLTTQFMVAGAVSIPLVLLARWVSVLIPVVLMHPWREFTPGTISIMTWGGLRGGISVALALSLPGTVQGRDLILTITYMVVIWSILVQGTTVSYLVSRLAPRPIG